MSLKTNLFVRLRQERRSSPNLRSQRGSAIVEMVFAFPVVAVVLSIGGFLLYLAFAKIWITRAVREASVCLVSPVTETRCRHRFERTLKVGLPVGSIEIEEFDKGVSGSSVEVSYRIGLGVLRHTKLGDRGVVDLFRISNSVSNSF